MADLRFVQTRGTGARFEFNKREGSVLLVSRTEGLEVRYIEDDAWTVLEPGESARAPLAYEGLMSVLAGEPGAYSALIHHVDDVGQVLDELSIQLHVLHVRVDVDADRDGVIADNEDGKRNWVWGAGQRGAIVLVNNDRDTASLSEPQAEDSELTEVLIRPTGTPIPPQCELVLVVTRDEAARISLYRAVDGGLELLLGVDPADPDAQPRTVSSSLGAEGVRCFLEAHEYPGPFFEGLLELELQLRETGRTIGNDRALIRVAPWIMTPNTLPVEEVYACDTSATDVPNEEFLTALQESARTSTCRCGSSPSTSTRGIAGSRTSSSSASARARRTCCPSSATARATGSSITGRGCRWDPISATSGSRAARPTRWIRSATSR
jgi:protein-arginine deiminase